MSQFVRNQSEQKDEPELCVRSKIKTVLDADNHRSAIFVCDVRKGDVIFRNAPFNAPQLDTELRGERCNYCFCKPNLAMNEKLSSCSRCSAVFYCDRECQRKDFTSTRHKLECRRIAEALNLGFHGEHLNKLLLLMKTGKALLDESQGHDLEDECHITDGVCSCGLKHVGSLSFNGEFTGEKTPNVDIISATTSTALNLMFKGKAERVDNAVFVDMLYHMFDQNNFGISDELCNPVGSGVFPHAAVLNHSCCPNAVMRYRFEKHKLPLLECVALTHSKKGDECVHSYVDLTYSDEMRQSYLRSNYDFDCTCKRCNRLCGLKNKLDAHRGAIEALVQDPLTLKSFLQKNLSDVGSLQGICELLAVPSSSESPLYPGLAGLGHESSSTAWCQRWEELKKKSATIYSRRLYEDAANTFTEFVYRFQMAQSSKNGRIDEDLARVLIESALMITSFLVLTSCGTRMNPMLGLHLFTLADICKGLRSSALNAPDPEPFYEWALSILMVTHGMDSNFVRILTDNHVAEERFTVEKVSK